MIYLDNSATTPLSDAVKSAIIEALECYGNPSSLHFEGDKARRALVSARNEIMRGLGARNGKLIFTSCGSEASNLAIKGSVAAKKRRTSNRIITTDSEHPSVANTLNSLEGEGFEIVRIPTKSGMLDREALLAALDKPIFMASVMLVNNETGAVYDVFDTFSEIKKKYPDAICHCDAVQGFLKVRFSPASLNADMITISGHKVHAPKGIGALWVSDRIIKEKKLVSVLLGGGQEDGFRSGTENTIGIIAFAKAVSEGVMSFPQDVCKMSDLRKYAVNKLAEIGRGVKINEPALHASHIISVTVHNIKSQTMLNHLSSKGICVSSGSACSSHSNKPSSALLSFGLAEKEADSTIRISLSKYNTKEEIDLLVNAIEEGIEKLVKVKR